MATKESAPKPSQNKKAVAENAGFDKEPSRPRGRPEVYTVDKANEIVLRVSNGEPLAAICREDGMPGVTTVWRWGKTKPEFAEAIAHARETGYDILAAQCLEIADTPVEGVEYTTKADGGIEEKRGDMLGHRKLQIETRLKLLAKWDPKRYGDKLDVTQEVKLTGSVSYKANIPPRGGSSS